MVTVIRMGVEPGGQNGEVQTIAFIPTHVSAPRSAEHLDADMHDRGAVSPSDQVRPIICWQSVRRTEIVYLGIVNGLCGAVLGS